MNEIIQFPKLGIKLEISPYLFHFGNVGVRWYGFIIVLGFALGVFYAYKKVKTFGLVFDQFFDVTIGGIIGAIIGARLYYVAFSFDYFKNNLLEIFAIRNGGIAIYGAIIGAAIGGYIVCRMTKIKFLPVADIAAIGFLIGQSIGRWGNFFNVEAFGNNTNLPWGMTSNRIVTFLEQNKTAISNAGVTVDSSVPVHPTFLYESIWCLIGFILLNTYIKKRKYDGEIALMYLGWYSLGRIFIEGVRTDSLMLGQFRVSQLLAVLITLTAITIYVLVNYKIKNKLFEPVLYVNSEQSKLSVFKFERAYKKQQQLKNAKKQEYNNDNNKDNLDDEEN